MDYFANRSKNLLQSDLTPSKVYLSLNTNRIVEGNYSLGKGIPNAKTIELFSTVERGIDEGLIQIASGASSLVALTDTPALIGNPGEILAVNAAGTDFEYITVGGVGDMTKAVYDPTNVNGDVFDIDNTVESATNKVMTAAERTQIIKNTVQGVYNNDADAITNGLVQGDLYTRSVGSGFGGLVAQVQ